MWRDEAGAVLNQISARDFGIKAPAAFLSSWGRYSSASPRPRTLVVIPEADTDVEPRHQRQLAKALGADLLVYQEMTHCGPLLSTRAATVAADCERWMAESNKL
jgi:hypothetical protein